MRRTFTFFIFLFLLASQIYPATTGRIKGKILEEGTGNPLVGANVIVVGTSFGAAADINGDYVINNLEAGTYEVKASFIGYQTVTISNVRIYSDLTTDLNFDLPSEGITASEVTIVAQKPLVNKSNTNAVRVTTADDIESLPVRGMNNIFALNAGVVLQDNVVFIRGGRLDEVGYYLEGVSARNVVTGGNAVRVVQDAVEEVQVQAGGYTAEYGGANAGIIRQQLKTGTKDFRASVEYTTDNISFSSKSNAFDGKKRLGTYWYGYNEFTGTLSGPVVDERFKLFGLFNYNYQTDANPQPYPGVNIGMIGDETTGDSLNFIYPAGAVQGNPTQTFTYSGTFTMDLKPFQVRFAGTFSDNEGYIAFNTHRNPGNLANMLNVGRTERLDQNNGTGSVKITHVLNDKMYYEITGGYFRQTLHRYDPYLVDDFLNYGDSLVNAQYGFTNFATRYTRPDRIDIYNFSFNGYGDVMSGYQKARRESFTVSGGFSWMPNNIHSIKLGGEFQQFKIRNYSFGNETVFSLAGIIANRGTRTIEEIVTQRGPNNYGYDVLGNEYDGGGIYAPKKPVFASAYVQDKIDLEDIILNLGLRFDYIDIDNLVFVNPELPDVTVDYNSGFIDEAGLKKSNSYSGVSPRIGISFPVTEQTIFHAQFGKFVQQTRLADIYQGLAATSSQLRGGLWIGAPIGFDVRPTRTTQYEVGFTQQVGSNASFDITGYYKDIKDQVIYDAQDVSKNSQFKSYYILRNGDFATTKGIELSFNLRRTNRIAINASLSFQDAQGTGSFPNSNRGIVGAPLDGVTVFNPQYISPLEYNNAYRGNLNLDYHFGIDDGPKWLSEAGVSLLMSFTSGHPYTMGIGGADLEGESRSRQPVEALNSSTTPATFQTDLRIDKTFSLFDQLKVNVYVFVINLFDTKNVQNVFLRTGTTTDDGYISNPNLSGELVNRDKYSEIYRAVNIDYYERYQAAPFLSTVPYFYGAPRQIRFGIKLEY